MRRFSVNPRLVTWGLVLLLAGIGAGVSPDRLHAFDRHVLPKEALLHAAALLVSLVGLQSCKRKDPVDIAVLSFVALSFVSAIFAVNPWVAFRSFALTFSAVVVFRAARVLSGAGQTPRLLGGVALVAVTCAVPALLETFGVIDGWSTIGRAPSGTFGNRNALAHTLALALPATVWTVVFARTRVGRAGAGVALVLVVAALTLSRCRSAWLGLGIAAVLVLLAVAHRWWRARAEPAQGGHARGARVNDPSAPVGRALWVVCALTCGVAVALLPNELRWRSDTPYAESLGSFLPGPTKGLERRVAQASFTRDMAMDAPVLGVGPGNFRVHTPHYAAIANATTAGPEQTITRLPNNDWLGVWAERGTGAMICLVVLLALLLREFWRLLSTEPSYALVGGAMLTLLLPMAWFDAVLTQAAPVAVAALGFGAVLPVAPEPRARRGWTWLGAMLVFVALVRSGVQLWAGHLYAARPLNLERLELSAELDPANEPLQRDVAELWIGRGECGRAFPYVERLVRHYPYDRATQRLVAKCK